jgi:very-short-patch-repair endonuclease
MLKSMYQNGTGVSSQQQRHICELLNGKLNYPVDRCQLDIAYPDTMIYIEYNGGGHYAWDTIENKEKDDMKRYSYLKQFSWKMIRIVCKCDKLYDDNEMINLVNECKDYLLNSKHSWIEINIDENKIKCKEFKRDI